MDTPESRFRQSPQPKPKSSFDWPDAVIAAVLAVGAVVFFAIVVVIAILAMGVNRSRAQDCAIGDFGCGHAQWHHWYSTGEQRADGTPGPIMRPHQPTIGCCGIDCRPTKTKFEGGQWFALIDGKYEAIPDNRIKYNVVSPNMMGHICAERRMEYHPITIHCFIRPGGAS
jgi:hypothetical protein